MNPLGLSHVTAFISEHFRDLQQFARGISFSKAVRVGMAVTLPIILGIQLGYLEIGLALSLGAFWSSPSDVIGNFQHKKVGILISAILTMFVTFIKGYLHIHTWWFLPVLGGLTFAIAYISIYGFRASLVSFSGLMALVLSFSQDTNKLEIYQYA